MMSKSNLGIKALAVLALGGVLTTQAMAAPGHCEVTAAHRTCYGDPFTVGNSGLVKLTIRSNAKKEHRQGDARLLDAAGGIVGRVSLLGTTFQAVNVRATRGQRVRLQGITTTEGAAFYVTATRL